MLWVGSVISRQVWLRLLIFVIVITTFTNTVSANKIKGIETRLIQGVSVMPDSRSASKLGTNTKRLQKRTSTAALGNSRPSLSDSLERVLGPQRSHELKSEGGPITSPPIRNVVANSSGVLTKRLQNRTSKAALGNSRPSLSDSSERWSGPTHTLELTSHSEHKLTKSNAASAMTHYVVKDYITKEKKDFESEIEGLVDSLASYVLEGLESTVLGEGEKTVNGTRPGKWNYTVEYEQPQLDLHTFITGGGSVEEDSSKSLLVLGPEPPLPAPVVTTTTTMTPTVMPVTFFTTTKRGSFYKMKPQKGDHLKKS